jgi:hypothetical protein
MKTEQLINDVKALLQTAGCHDIASHTDRDQRVVTARADGTSSVLFRWAREPGGPPVTSGGGAQPGGSALDVGVVPGIVAITDGGKTNELAARGLEQITAELSSGRLRPRRTPGQGPATRGGLAEFDPQPDPPAVAAPPASHK